MIDGITTMKLTTGFHLPNPFTAAFPPAPIAFKPDIPALFEQIRDEADKRAFDDPPPVFLRDGSPEYETLLREIDPTRQAIARRR